MDNIFVSCTAATFPSYHLTFKDETSFREEVLLKGPTPFEVRYLSNMISWKLLT